MIFTDNGTEDEANHFFFRHEKLTKIIRRDKEKICDTMKNEMLLTFRISSWEIELAFFFCRNSDLGCKYARRNRV